DDRVRRRVEMGHCGAMRLQEECVESAHAAERFRGLALAALEHEMTRGEWTICCRVVGDRTSARDCHALAHQPRRLTLLRCGDQIQRAALIIGTPASPIAEARVPAKDLAFCRYGSLHGSP